MEMSLHLFHSQVLSSLLVFLHILPITFSAKDEMGGACSTNGGEEEYRILVGKP
jgi:hypothetical protein